MSYATISMARQLCGVVVVAHWTACFWGMVAELQARGDDVISEEGGVTG